MLFEQHWGFWTWDNQLLGAGTSQDCFRKFDSTHPVGKLPRVVLGSFPVGSLAMTGATNNITCKGLNESHFVVG